MAAGSFASGSSDRPAAASSFEDLLEDELLLLDEEGEDWPELPASWRGAPPGAPGACALGAFPVGVSDSPGNGNRCAAGAWGVVGWGASPCGAAGLTVEGVGAVSPG